MVNTIAVKEILVVIIILGILSTTGPTASLAQFTDEEAGYGTISAASNFNINGGGNGNEGNSGQAFNDANGNDIQDDGEETYNNANKITQLDDNNTNLILPSEVGTVSPNGNKDIAITANSINSEVSFEAQNSNIHLTASGGEVNLGGQSVNSGTGSVTIDASENVDLSNATLSAQNGGITIVTDGSLNIDGATLTANGDIVIRARTISADSAQIQPQNGGATLSATNNGGGELGATGAAMSGGNDGITLESVGSLQLNGTELTSQNGQATADLGNSSMTLYVDSTNIDDSDGMLEYNPDGILVVGSAKNDTSP